MYNNYDNEDLSLFIDSTTFDLPLSLKKNIGKLNNNKLNELHVDNYYNLPIETIEMMEEHYEHYVSGYPMDPEILEAAKKYGLNRTYTALKFDLNNLTNHQLLLI